jgi:N-acyl amino acid synthase of PEP-CTERM/exosortase system
MFRRRARESATQYGDIAETVFSESEKRVIPYIAISLFLAATVLTELTDRRNAFAMMEPALPRLMNRVGIVFEQVGGIIDYHGQRAAHFCTTESALEGLVPEFRGLYEIIRESLVADFEASMGVHSDTSC